MVQVLTGSNAFLLRVELQQIIAHFVKKHSDLGLERINAGDASFDAILGSLQSLPFLVEKKLVVVNDISANKEASDKIEELLDNIAQGIDLIIFEPKFDKRTQLYKVLKKRADLKEVNELDEFAVLDWLVIRAKDLGASLSKNEARYLVQRVGVNQMLLDNEIQKLALYDQTISRESINLLTEPNPQSTVFNLLDEAFAGRSKRALELYEDQRKQKVEPHAILAMITWQLHILALVKTGEDKNGDEIAAQAKLNPFVVRKSSQIARRLGLSQIRKLVTDTLELDIRLKTTAINADDALKNYLVQLAII